LDMADDWRDVVLEELAAPVRNALGGGPFGSDLVSADYSSTGVPVIRGENLSAGRWVAGEFVFVPPAKAEHLSANTAGPLDIVFTQRGANHYRQVAIVPVDANRRFVISQSQMKLTVDREKADPLFVYYQFRSPLQQEYLQRHAIQTGVPHTNLSILRKVPLRVPSLQTQRTIVRILGTLDDKIELNRRMNESLEAMARALFKSWFMDFLPVRAKMAAKENNPSLLLPQGEANTWFVYAIECNDGSLYIGQTEDLRQRWLQHVGGRGGSWTRQHPPVRVPYWESSHRGRQRSSVKSG
jgi:type I restriction enzyme, S subunit